MFKNWYEYSGYQKKKLVIIMNSTIHLIVVFIYAVYIKFNGADDYLAVDKVYRTTELSYLMYQFSSGYFLWDIYIICTIKPLSPAYFLHGVGCCQVFWLGNRGLFHYYGIRLLSFEFSTIFLNARQWLSIVNKKHWAIDYLDPVFAYSFLAVRIVYGSYLLIEMAIETYVLVGVIYSNGYEKIDYVTSEATYDYYSLGASVVYAFNCFLCFGFSVLNSFWMYEIYQKSKSKKKKKVVKVA